MALTALDAVTALIVIDLQKGIAGHAFLRPLAEVVERTGVLLRAFRAAGLPVVLVNVAARPPGRTEQGPRGGISFEEGWTDLLPELERRAEDMVVTKGSWGAFARTDLEERLRERGVTQVVVAGIVTSGGVEATARQAYELGFHVTLALDAMTDIGEEAESYSVRNVFPRLGETGLAREIAARVGNRSVER